MVDPINLRGSYGGNTYLHDANTSDAATTT